MNQRICFGFNVIVLGIVAMEMQALAAVYMKEAENTELSGSIRWRAAVEEGTYRLFARARSGWSGDVVSAVRGETQYRIKVDEKPVPLQLVPDTLAYHGDEHNFTWIVSSALPLTQGLHTLDLRTSNPF